MAELKSTVHVYDEHGVPQIFGPGDTVPAWAQKLITNPNAWAGESRPIKAAPAADKPAEVKPPSEVPPKSGPRATVDAWLSYAAAHQVAVEDDATRKDIIAALDAAGVPTE
ncbi:hypothetical protein P5G50_18355 [Leifsonia sp. F6_8S_P_1B]|uniref:Lsr2 protein n=1 Tax=Leifsonia williamsii TaxID=3035919 RepID=A0ABT8KG19_9MICO|nr:hypothetical protein [Leifsonia williamsii]MDN4616414.1 hypothetical protein [Leifsonia williamsii]